MSDLSALQRWCDGEAGWLRERLETFVRLESPTHDKAAVDRCGTAIAKTLSDIGARVTTFPNLERGDHLRAEIDGHGPQILILGHFDTVWDLGQIDRMPLREAGGRLYGPGIFDMKAGLTVALLAVRAIQASPMSAAPHVVVLLTSDEEVGSGTSRPLIEDEARRSRAVLVMEPSLPGGAAKTARKGCGEFELVVRGIAAHAGLDPGKGASAIHELAHQILAVSQFQDLARGISVNAGGRLGWHPAQRHRRRSPRLDRRPGLDTGGRWSARGDDSRSSGGDSEHHAACHRRVRPPAARAERGRHASLPHGPRRGPRPATRSARRSRWRGVGREFYGRPGGSHSRRTRPRGGWGPRAR